MTCRFAMIVLLLASAACNEQQAIEARFFECRDLTANRDEYDRAIACFDRRSQKLLKRLRAERKRSSGTLNYLSRFKRLLDFDDILAPAEISGEIAVLEVGKRKRKEKVVFRREDGEWRIDLRELTRFWSELDRGARGQ
jgi:hypothetical protein